jgi:glycerophosphoryl diester phosphodiesterase
MTLVDSHNLEDVKSHNQLKGAPEHTDIVTQSMHTPRSRIGVRNILKLFRGPPSITTDDSLLISAHRGVVSSGVPENSILSIQAAVDAGCVVLEIDIRSTADGVVVCLHDHGLGRATNIAEDMGRHDLYDPSTGTGYNPLVKQMNWVGCMDQLYLKDENGNLT